MRRLTEELNIKSVPSCVRVLIVALGGVIVAGEWLRRLPLLPYDLQRLRGILGKGEVAIEVSALGATRIQETSLAAVWWIDHSNDLGDHLWSTVEMAFVPTLLPATIEEASIEKLVREHFNLTPAGIIRDLELLKPIYQATAAHGHFGREPGEGGPGTFTWERTDKAAALKEAAATAAVS